MSHFMPIQLLWVMVAVIRVGAAMASDSTPARGCPWEDSAAEWALARQLPAGEISGSVGSVLVPFLHRHGIAVSFISMPHEDVNIDLNVHAGATAGEVLEEMSRQVAGYRYGVIAGKVVIYPKGREYETRIEMGGLGNATRAQAMYSLLRQLGAKHRYFQGLEMPIMRGAGRKSLYGDQVEVGGVRSVVEHLVSLTGTRPMVAFRLLSKPDGHLAFRFDWIPLFKGIEMHAPAVMEVGASGEGRVTGTLIDGSVVPLGARDCGVEYVVGDSGVLEVDDVGRIVARKAGEETIVVYYEEHSAQARLHVQ